MLLFKTAIKNILGAGRRTWLNVAVLSFTFVLMTAFNGLIDGWVNDAIVDTRDWETGDGQFWHQTTTGTTLHVAGRARAHPRRIRPLSPINHDPRPVIQAVAYESGNMQNVLLRGIDPSQQILEIPSGSCNRRGSYRSDYRKRMARTLNARVGDNLLVRWRDKNGAFDAREIVVTGIFDTSIATVDAGQVWVNLHQLQQMTGMEGEATYLVAPRLLITGRGRMEI